MMMPYASNTGTKRNLDALRRAGWALLLTPQNSKRRDAFRFAIDNGAWSSFTLGKEFDDAAFLKVVEAEGSWADWVVLPDIVAGGLSSLKLSLSWIPRLHDLRLLLLPLQDGMERSDIEPVLAKHKRLGLFLGGTTDWKLKTMYDWGILACAARRHYHVARVNTARRIRLAAEAGADSFDGTSATKYSVTLPLLEAARQQPSLLIPSHLPWPL